VSGRSGRASAEVAGARPPPSGESRAGPATGDVAGPQAIGCVADLTSFIVNCEFTRPTPVIGASSFMYSAS
jgi:hypothetical protein